MFTSPWQRSQLQPCPDARRQPNGHQPLVVSGKQVFYCSRVAQPLLFTSLVFACPPSLGSACSRFLSHMRLSLACPHTPPADWTPALGRVYVAGLFSVWVRLDIPSAKACQSLPARLPQETTSLLCFARGVKIDLQEQLAGSVAECRAASADCIAFVVWVQHELAES